jgi:dCMP deaminase
MDIALRTAQLSYAEKLKVGAILVKDDKIISHSWNGSPRNWDNICENKIYVEKLHNPYLNELILEDENGFFYFKTKPEVTHAEEAMLMKVASSTESTEGSVLFCTHSCCMNCAKLIYGAKISEFYFQNEYRSQEGIEFLKKCGIKVTRISP